MLSKLIWKQWREQRWKLAFLTVVLMAFTTIGLRSRMVEDEVIVVLGALIGAMLIPVFVAMGLIAPDRADGSFATLMALPVRPIKVLAAITFSGVVQCVVPLAASGLVAWAIAGGRELTGGDIVRVHAIAAALSVVLLIWTFSFSVRQGHESRVGLIGLAVLIGWGLSVMIAGVVLPLWMLVSGHALMSVHPLAMMRFLAREVAGPSEVALTICVQIAMVGLLWWWALRRVARPGRAQS